VIVLFLGLELIANVPKMIPNCLNIDRKFRVKCTMKCIGRKSNCSFEEMLVIPAGEKGVCEDLWKNLLCSCQIHSSKNNVESDPHQEFLIVIVIMSEDGRIRRVKMGIGQVLFDSSIDRGGSSM